MTEKDIQKLYKLVNNVKAASNHDVVLIANDEKQVNMFKELFPGYKVICAYGRLEDNDKVYILPTEETKPIKICYD